MERKVLLLRLLVEYPLTLLFLVLVIGSGTGMWSLLVLVWFIFGWMK